MALERPGVATDMELGENFFTVFYLLLGIKRY
jgi:hypothetical protein